MFPPSLSHIPLYDFLSLPYQQPSLLILSFFFLFRQFPFFIFLFYFCLDLVMGDPSSKFWTFLRFWYLGWWKEWILRGRRWCWVLFDNDFLLWHGRLGFGSKFIVSNHCHRMPIPYEIRHSILSFSSFNPNLSPFQWETEPRPIINK